MSEERNYGIDLLKIVSMFMVVILHVLGHGGVLETALDLTLNDTIAWFVEILCMCAVNIFALTTGYLYINRKFKYKNIIGLWILVLFYNVVFTLLIKRNDLLSIVTSFFPVSNNVYWYFSSYFAFILFVPFINKYLCKISEDEHRTLIITTLFVMCGLGFFTYILNNDVLRINRGYSPIWLASLYIVGAYIKLYDFNFKHKSKLFYFLIYLLSSLVALLARIVILKFSILNMYFSDKVLLEYMSFPIVINSIVLFLLFLKIKFNDYLKKILSFFSGLSFSVYLIHEHSLMRTYFLNNLYIHFAYMPAYQMIFMVLFTAFVIYVVCTLIDIVRYYLFKIFRVEKLSCWLDEKIVSLLTKKG